MNETGAYKQSARYLLFDPESPGVKAIWKFWDDFANAVALQMAMELERDIMGDEFDEEYWNLQMRDAEIKVVVE